MFMKITTETQLRELYKSPSERAQNKVLKSLDKHAQHFINLSPFFVLSSRNAAGKADTSPRGGQPGFVHILSSNQILIPDASGNNRLDTLVNIVETGQVGLLFLLPGVDETLRINGTAEISADADFLSRFAAEKKPPKTCVLVHIEEVFLHCAKALMRSKLWDEAVQIKREDFPTMGQMLKDQLGDNQIPETQQQMVERYNKDL